MMLRKLSLLLALTIVSVGTRRLIAQDKLNREDEMAATASRGPIESMRVEDMTSDQLNQLLSEFESGKRDDRDGYIIANQLWFDYQVRKESSSPAAIRIHAILERLRTRHPDFASLQDFRLSDQILYGTKKEQERRDMAQAANSWVPQDNTPSDIKGSDHKVIVVYQFKLDFATVPADCDLRMDPTAPTTLKIYRGNILIKPSELNPYKEITFKHRFQIMPFGSDHVDKNIFVCSDILHQSYYARTEDEAAAMAAKGFANRSMPWINRTGQIDQICAVMALDGKIIYSFPIKQKSPGLLAEPLDITADGKKAAVMIGERVDEEGEDGMYTFVGHPREVWIWQQGAALKKIKIADPKLNRNDLRFKFEGGGF